MSKLKLSINIEEEIDPKLVEQIYKEVEGYSLTPRNIGTRKLKVYKEKFDFVSPEVEYNTKEMINPIEEKISGVLHTNLNEGKKKDLVADILKESFVQSVCDVNQTNTYIKDFNALVKFTDISQYPYTFESIYDGAMRLGINIHNTKQIVEDFNNKLLELKEPYNEEIGYLQEDVKSNKSGGSKLKLAFDDNSCKVLHPLEITLLANAINTALEKKQKAILVDIFERDKSGMMQVEEIKSLETEELIIETSSEYKSKTHTIVLCRKQDVDNSENFSFLVIDPSNSEFSQHLGMLGVNKIIGSLLQKDIQLEVSDKSYKIYEQNSKIGTGLAVNKFRDCIDIAFKLAKDLNQFPNENINFDTNDKFPIIFDNLIANDIVKYFTNNRDLDDGIEESLSDKKFLNYPFRGKQLTDKEKGKPLYEKQTSVYKKVNEHVKDLPLNPLNKVQVIEDMKNAFNNPMNLETTKPFLEKVDKSISLTKQIDEVFMSQEILIEKEVEFLSDVFIQVNGELYEYYQ